MAAAYLIAQQLGLAHQAEVAAAARRDRVFRDRTQPLEVYDDREVIDRYRLPRHCILSLVDDLSEEPDRATRRNQALSPLQQVLTALSYYATGNFLRSTGDHHGLSRMAASRCIHSVSSALAAKVNNYIHFPSTEAEATRIQAEFMEYATFPKVLGAVDGCLVPIIAPHIDEHLYICRKNYHAINVQGICDVNLRFTNIVAQWPGSSHDSYVLMNSTVSHLFERDEVPGDGWLIGDQGYPLRSWLLTIIGNPTNAAEERYNRRHKRCRNPIERTFGVWKARFRCLDKTGGKLMFRPSRCCKVIVATAVLHNICIENRIPADGLEINPVDNNNDLYVGPLNDGAETRRRLIEQRFL